MTSSFKEDEPKVGSPGPYGTRGDNSPIKELLESHSSQQMASSMSNSQVGQGVQGGQGKQLTQEEEVEKAEFDPNMVLNVKYFNNSLEWDSLVG